MKSFLKGQYQNGDMVSTFCNRKFTKLQRSSNLPYKVCGINTLWCITLLYVNQKKKKKKQKNTAMHSSSFCLFSSFKPDQRGSHSLKHAHRNVQSQVSHLFLLHPWCVTFNTLCYIITPSLKLIVYSLKMISIFILFCDALCFYWFFCPAPPVF